MKETPCRVTLDLNEYEHQQEESHARNQDMRELAFSEANTELLSNLESFADALCDINDTLAHWNIPDSKMQTVGYLRGPLKRAVAIKALKAMQSLLADQQYAKPMTERETAIADLLSVEIEYWREQKVQELVEAYS